ncbi:MAG: hypothetical protein AB7O24_32770 [Kofleriaceae bacterium]
MRAWLLIVVVGCSNGGDNDYKIDHGGGGGVIGGDGDDSASDAGVDSAADGITGRVCLVTDLRTLSPCANTGVADLLVQLGTKTTTTNDDGSFTIPTPSGSNLLWRVTGANLAPSAMPFSTSKTIPAINADVYDDLLLSNGLILSGDQGSLMVRVTRDNTAVVGATATASPESAYAPYYDSNVATVWDQDETGSYGVAWIVGAEPGTTTITVTPDLGTAGMIELPVETGGITFGALALPM